MENNMKFQLYSKLQFANEVLQWFDDFDKAIDKAPTKNQWDGVFGVQIPGQREITQKFKKKLAILVSKGRKFGHDVSELAEHQAQMEAQLAEEASSDNEMFDD
tara:strand:+ start:1519 stop:1827 length:309 start_codon:yes stop_codon:yes gene_type:complete